MVQIMELDNGRKITRGVGNSKLNIMLFCFELLMLLCRLCKLCCSM